MCSMFYRKGTSLMSLLWQESLCKLHCNISFISIHLLKELGRFVDDFADQLLLIYAVSHLLQTKNQTSITWVLLHWRIWQGNADCSFFFLYWWWWSYWNCSRIEDLYLNCSLFIFSQIATAFGPCGNNRDYLFLLEKAMFDIGEQPFYTPTEQIIKITMNPIKDTY